MPSRKSFLRFAPLRNAKLTADAIPIIEGQAGGPHSLVIVFVVPIAVPIMALVPMVVMVDLPCPPSQ